mmetsp:Transcript_76897/g.212510  ORF Transcript_76897/g.212510 Transcript_76897/m.212510 type:complete len:233 (+) Transcript_76897:701-1399(+)
MARYTQTMQPTVPSGPLDQDLCLRRLWTLMTDMGSYLQHETSATPGTGIPPTCYITAPIRHTPAHAAMGHWHSTVPQWGRLPPCTALATVATAPTCEASAHSCQLRAQCPRVPCHRHIVPQCHCSVVLIPPRGQACRRWAGRPPVPRPWASMLDHRCRHQATGQYHCLMGAATTHTQWDLDHHRQDTGRRCWTAPRSRRRGCTGGERRWDSKGSQRHRGRRAPALTGLGGRI